MRSVQMVQTARRFIVVIGLVLAVVSLCGAAHACGTSDAANAAIKSRHGSEELGPFFAILIGVTHYDDAGYQQVDAASRDVAALRKILQEEYGYPVDHILTMIDPTREELRARFQEFGDKLAENAKLLVYFSGHGEQGTTRQNGYWVPKDGKFAHGELTGVLRQDVEDSQRWVARQWVIERVAEMRPVHIMVVDDSCYSGVSSNVAAATDADAAGLSDFASAPRGAETIASSPLESRVYGAGHGGAPSPGKDNDIPRVRMWLSAGRETQVVAANDQASANSLFTTVFLGVLHDNEILLDGTAVFETVRTRLATRGAAQVPQYAPIAGAGHDGGDFLFAKQNYGRIEVHLAFGTISVSAAPQVSLREPCLEELVADQLQATDAQSAHSQNRNHFFFLAVARPKLNRLKLTLVDLADDHVVSSVEQALSPQANELPTNVRAAVVALRDAAHTEIESKTVSEEIVARAWVAQRKHSVDIDLLLLGLSVYVDLDGKGLLNNPAFSCRLDVNFNLNRWLLIGASAGFDTVEAKSVHDSFMGDLSNGSSTHNKLVGDLALHTGTLMVRLMARQSEGLVLPFGYLGAGGAYHVLNLGNEYFEGESPSDSLPINAVNVRQDTTDLAFAVELGGGVHYLLSEHWSVLARGNLFKTFHDMKIRSHIEGFSESKERVEDFQKIQGVSAHAGVAFWL